MKRSWWRTVRRRRTEPNTSGASSAEPSFFNPLPGANSGHTWDRRVRGTDGRWVARDPAERFWAKVERVGECLLWTGDLDKDGYGVFKVKVDGKWVPVAAHVWAWILEHGPVPDGHTLDHLCHSLDDTCRGLGRLCPHRRCVRTDHLEPVPSGENQRRARMKKDPVSEPPIHDASCLREGQYFACHQPERRHETGLTQYDLRCPRCEIAAKATLAVVGDVRVPFHDTVTDVDEPTWLSDALGLAESRRRS